MNILKKIPIPIPICCIVLGLFGMGNLLQSYSETVRQICGAVATLLMVAFFVSVAVDFKKFKNEMKNPLIAGVFCTLPMAIMMFATYLKPYVGGGVSQVIWYMGILLHIIMIVYFTAVFILRQFSLEKVFASWFIVFVGIAMAGITAPAFESTGLGAFFCWFGIVSLVVLLVLVTVRYVKKPAVPQPAQPAICIYAAPTSLCIAGYIQSVTPKSLPFLLVLWAVATVCFVFACVKFLQYLKLPFFPSYAAYTFPFVISAIATKQLMACAANLGSPLAFLEPIVLIETIIAVCTTLYAIVRYILFIFGKKKSPAQAAK